MNRYREKETSESKPEKKSGKPLISASSILDSVDNIKILPGQGFSAKLIPFILYLGGLGLIYIANANYSEKTVREIDKINKELKTLRSEYISGKSELMFNSKQSEVAKSVAPLGIVESTEAPRKIVLNTPAAEKED